MKTIKDVNLKGKRVLCRLDLNSPLDDNKKLKDDLRIRASTATITKAEPKYSTSS